MILTNHEYYTVSDHLKTCLMLKLFGYGGIQ